METGGRKPMMTGSTLRRLCAALLAFAALAMVNGAPAQDKGALDPKPLPPLANPSSPATPARELFGRAQEAAPLHPDPIGFYSRGCLAGGEPLPINGPHWQVMRLSRNRNWGHPNLIAFLKHFSSKAARESGWPGLLIGDMSQPRGGPMLSGHASHQIGLDADIWLTPMPNRELAREEREELMSTDVVRDDRLDVRPEVWSAGHIALIRAAAMEPAVQRIFVNAAIKRALCRSAQGESWMHKVRPMWGHNYHFHIRLHCPNGSNCRDQDPTPPGDGCDASLAWWFKDEVLRPRTPGGKSWPPMTMAGLPSACREVLRAQ